MPSELIHVRVKDTGAEGPIRAHLFDPDVYEKTDRPALDRSGDPVPWKPKTTVNQAAEQKKTQAGQKAKSDKENT